MDINFEKKNAVRLLGVGTSCNACNSAVSCSGTLYHKNSESFRTSGWPFYGECFLSHVSGHFGS